MVRMRIGRVLSRRRFASPLLEQVTCVFSGPEAGQVGQVGWKAVTLCGLFFLLCVFFLVWLWGG